MHTLTFVSIVYGDSFCFYFGSGTNMIDIRYPHESGTSLLLQNSQRKYWDLAPSLLDASSRLKIWKGVRGWCGGERQVKRFFWEELLMSCECSLNTPRKEGLSLYLLHLKPREAGLWGPLRIFWNTFRKQHPLWVPALHFDIHSGLWP